MTQNENCSMNVEQHIELEIKQGKPMVSSLYLAAHFEKEHFHVLRDIREMMDKDDDDFTESNFEGSEYLDSTGRSLPMYYLTRDAFVLVVMSYTGKKALRIKKAYIRQFNAMEQALKLGQVKLNNAGNKYATSRDIAALMGFMGYRAKEDGIAHEEAVEQLCKFLHISEIGQMLKSDVAPAYQHVWLSYFKVTNVHEERGSEAEYKTLNGLIDTWECAFGQTREYALEFSGNLCGLEVADVNDIPRAAIPQMERALFQGLTMLGKWNQWRKVFVQ